MGIYNTSTVYRPSSTAYRTTTIYLSLYYGDPAPVYEDFHLVDSDNDGLVDADGDHLLARERVR